MIDARHAITETTWIDLTRGHRTLVDADAASWLSRMKWHATSGRRCGVTAARNEKVGDRRVKSLMHRVIMLAEGHNLTGKYVDHINGDTLDNRRVNLRVATPQESSFNRGSWGSTSRHVGVHFDAERGRWRASIQVSGRKMQLGSYGSELEAVAARVAAEREHFGEFAPSLCRVCVVSERTN